MTTICPCCGQPIPATTIPTDDAESGVIYARESAEASHHFSRIKLEDLNGDPYHDWPLIAARFEYSLPDLVEAIREDRSRFLKGQAEPEQPQRQPAGPSQLWLDLDAIRPHLSKIVQRGQFTYGHQSRIAEALGVPNSGSYRRRIQNVVSALQRTVVKPSSSTAPADQGQAPDQGQERQAA